MAIQWRKRYDRVTNPSVFWSRKKIPRRRIEEFAIPRMLTRSGGAFSQYLPVTRIETEPVSKPARQGRASFQPASLGRYQGERGGRQDACPTFVTLSAGQPYREVHVACAVSLWNRRRSMNQWESTRSALIASAPWAAGSFCKPPPALPIKKAFSSLPPARSLSWCRRL